MCAGAHPLGRRERFHMLALTHSLATSVAVPIRGPWPQAFPAKDLCSNCGLCRSTVGVASVTEACAFIGDGMSRAESLEAQVHGRGRGATPRGTL